MRLIDADRLNEVIERNFCYPGCLKQIVDIQPTAYDVDKVVEQLEEKINNTADSTSGISARMVFGKAIEIVKAGGKVAENGTTSS